MIKLYAYTTKTYQEKGWYKIGDTKKGVESRVSDQDGSACPEELEVVREWELLPGMRDYAVHKVLQSAGSKRLRSNREWFELSSLSLVDEAVVQAKKDFLSLEGDYDCRKYQDAAKKIQKILKTGGHHTRRDSTEAGNYYNSIGEAVERAYEGKPHMKCIVWAKTEEDYKDWMSNLDLKKGMYDHYQIDLVFMCPETVEEFGV